MSIETEELVDEIWNLVYKKVIDNNTKPNIIIIHFSKKYNLENYRCYIIGNNQTIFGCKLIYATNIEENEILIY